MMPIVSVGWDVLAFVLCLVGFFFLVFANEREGRRLLHRPASQRERRICAAAGGGLLMLALWVCVQQWRGNFGSVLWFGWLTVAALTLIFALASVQEEERKGHHRHGKRHQLPEAGEASGDAVREDVDCHGAAPLAMRAKWGEHPAPPWNGREQDAPATLEPIPATTERPPTETSQSSQTASLQSAQRVFHHRPPGPSLRGPSGPWPSAQTSRLARTAIWGAFLLLPCLFLLSAWRIDPWPVLREDAVSGKVGPWNFTLAEVEPDAPKQGKSGAVMKAFELRFSDAAHPQIRAAYLQARKPRSLRASGIAFEGQHLRTANIPIPPAFMPEEQIWLTVEGWNGEVHQTVIDVAHISPSLARFLAGEIHAQPSDEGWDSTLTCWNEGTEILCQGATFGSGETRYMDGTAIEVSGENGEVILSTRLNRKGQIRFPRPEGAFYVLLEEGPGKTVEVNWRDVEAKP